MALRLLAALLALLWLGPRAAPAATGCDVPQAAADWAVSAPAAQGLDPAVLCSLGARLDGDAAMNVHGIVVVRGGRLVYEHYGAGRDERWGTKLGHVQHSADTKHDLRSVSKSVVSLLAGIAIDKGLIDSVEEPVSRWFPEAAARTGSGGEPLKLRHLLTMSSGIAWDESLPYTDALNTEVRMTRAADPYRFILEQPVVHRPGTQWTYSGGDTQLLAGVVARASGQPLAGFAKENLFDPLGITSFEWVRMPVSLEAAAASGLRLRPRDMAKLGLLVLNRGFHEGRRIVSQAWIDASIRPQFRGIDGIASLGYGYQWWTDHEMVGQHRIAWISAQGLGGQRIYIVPALDIVVAITAGFYNDPRQNEVPYQLFREHVLDAVRR
jgi:CubicO group peptidase (beta-lactamase class C family)